MIVPPMSEWLEPYYDFQVGNETTYCDTPRHHLASGPHMLGKRHPKNVP